MTYDPHDPDAVDEELAQLEGRAQFLEEAWRRIIRDPHGRIVLADIMATTGLHLSAYVPGSFDQTAHLEGMRQVGRAVREKIELLHSELIADVEARYREIVRDVGYGGSSNGRNDDGSGT